MPKHERFSRAWLSRKLARERLAMARSRALFLQSPFRVNQGSAIAKRIAANRAAAKARRAAKAAYRSRMVYTYRRR